MSLQDADALVESWIALHKSEHASPEYQRYFWAFNLLCDLVNTKPAAAWEIILEILRRDQSDRIYENLSAGPLEDLLANHGPEFIAKVEARALVDPAFRELLGGVWRNAIRQDVWDRLEAARGETW